MRTSKDEKLLPQGAQRSQKVEGFNKGRHPIAQSDSPGYPVEEGSRAPLLSMASLKHVCHRCTITRPKKRLYPGFSTVKL